MKREILKYPIRSIFRGSSPYRGFFVFMSKKIKKEETTMVMKKLFFVLFGLLFIFAGSSNFATGVGAETLKLQVSNVVTKGEIVPIENIEGTVLISMVRDGTFVIENGELGTMRFIGTACATTGKGGTFSGYIMYIFGDGSTILGTIQPGNFWPDPEKIVSGIQKGSGELIMGSGRFKGIKGTQTMTGKLLKTIKGEVASRVYNDFILTYTLSP
jgi:hypothetical protein